MLSLILAGETIFLPAFHLGRYFKSSLLTTYGIDEFQLGRLGALYGVLATVSYFLGGPLADRWAPRKLMSLSLVITALGSLYMAQFPSFNGLQALFAFWGVSTILGFWAPLIRATREWAKDHQQGLAFGILDGGRGLASAVIASAAAFAFAAMVGNQTTIAPDVELAAIRNLVYSYGVYCLVAAFCVWCFVPDTQPKRFQPPADNSKPQSSLLRRLGQVLRSPAIWLQAIVIIAAYSAFKMIDNYGIYAEDAYGYTRTASAHLIANISYVRVGAALGAGVLADKCLGVRGTIQVCFAVLILAYGMFLFITPHPGLAWLLVTNMVISCLSFFALRGIYFALLEESGTPRELTGTAVGIISFVGYTPEIYMGPLTGWLIREARRQGDVLAGYHQIFLFLFVLAIAGSIATFALRWFSARRPTAKTEENTDLA